MLSLEGKVVQGFLLKILKKLRTWKWQNLTVAEGPLMSSCLSFKDQMK